MAALVGFSDASYLSIKNINGEIVTCGALSGCSSVTTSVFSKIFGVPVAFFGVAHYALLFVVLLLLQERKDRRLLLLATVVASVGLVMSSWFVYVQLFVLHAICLFCMLSAVTCTVVMLLLIVGWKMAKEETWTPAPLDRTMEELE